MLYRLPPSLCRKYGIAGIRSRAQEGGDCAEQASGPIRRQKVLPGIVGPMIGHLEKTVIDCPEPQTLADFYCEVLGMRVNEDIDGAWVVIGTEPGSRQVAFQRVSEWVPPQWPDPAHPQQMHIDVRVADPDQAEEQLLALGATRAQEGRESGFRVFIDPAGHPLCIVFG